eukprot:4140496-Prymnesium_polylepis.1
MRGLIGSRRVHSVVNVPSVSRNVIHSGHGSMASAYDAPGGGIGRYARPAVPFLARGTCR